MAPHLRKRASANEGLVRFARVEIVWEIQVTDQIDADGNASPPAVADVVQDCQGPRVLGAEREGDPSPVVCWAGWNHLQQAQALATYYLARKDEGWSRERLLPLLAGLKELRPWLLQWHNQLDPQYGIGLGTYYADFLADELRELEATEEGLSS